MSNWSKSVIHGGIYAKAQSQIDCSGDGQKVVQKYQEFKDQLKSLLEIGKKSWEKSKKLYLSIKNNLKSHVSKKQELYWPVLVAIVLLLFAFASKIAFADMSGAPNNLPIKDNSKLNAIGFGEKKGSIRLCLAEGKNEIKIEKSETADNVSNDLREDITKIVKGTPMAAMIDPISEKDRTVAAFIVGIAMKESKFGVYSPKLAGRDCYNYWGFKGGGKTTSDGYSCFSSPEEAVNSVGNKIEKMIAKGVRTPAQAISWKCGSSCAGHGAENVRKWIADVGVNFYKINS
jgi:hypothetical protein